MDRPFSLFILCLSINIRGSSQYWSIIIEWDDLRPSSIDCKSLGEYLYPQRFHGHVKKNKRINGVIV